MTKLLKDNHQNGSTNNGASVDAVHILLPFHLLCVRACEPVYLKRKRAEPGL